MGIEASLRRKDPFIRALSKSAKKGLASVRHVKREVENLTDCLISNL